MPETRSSRFTPQPEPTTTDSAGPLMPPWPLADESRVGEWGFTCSFVIQLVRPEDARKAEKSDLDGNTEGSENSTNTAPGSTEAQP